MVEQSRTEELPFTDVETDVSRAAVDGLGDPLLVWEIEADG